MIFRLGKHISWIRQFSTKMFEIVPCKSVKFLNISDKGWKDDDIQYSVCRKNKSQWDRNMGLSNALGSSTLVILENLNSELKYILMDSGWNVNYMKECFSKFGIQEKLEQKEINDLIISHEHFDHFWGIEATLSFNPKINLYYPASFTQKAIQFIDKIDSVCENYCNNIKHIGTRYPLYYNEIYNLCNECVAINFDIDIAEAVKGEACLIFYVKNKGYVILTGCGHMGLKSIYHILKNNFLEGNNLYGLYGGLHIDPFRKFNDFKNTLTEYKKIPIKRWAPVHCTGERATKEMFEMGFPFATCSDKSLIRKKEHVIEQGEIITFD